VPEADKAVRLLIVEDHELLAGTLAFMLRQRGLEVQTIMGPDHEAIIATARRMAPVLVLLDLELGPALGSGRDLVGPLVEAGARVVMMTGVTDRARLAACVEAGAFGILEKTGAFADLVAAVGRAAAGEELLTDNERQELLAELRTQRVAEHARLAPFATLTTREEEVLSHIIAGETAETIAAGSFVSLATVRTQIRSILLKLGVKSQLAAVVLARDAGWPPRT